MENKISEFSDKCIIIKIRDNYPTLYERVRRCWKRNKERAEQADYVLAVIKNKVEGVFEPSQWYYIPMEECKKIGLDCNNRKQPCRKIGFVGKEADADVQSKYLNKYIPDKYRKTGARAAFLYTY
jgi:hypothetical protein